MSPDDHDELTYATSKQLLEANCLGTKDVYAGEAWAWAWASTVGVGSSSVLVGVGVLVAGASPLQLSVPDSVDE